VITSQSTVSSARREQVRGKPGGPTSAVKVDRSERDVEVTSRPRSDVADVTE